MAQEDATQLIGSNKWNFFRPSAHFRSNPYCNSYIVWGCIVNLTGRARGLLDLPDMIGPPVHNRFL